MNDKIVEQMSRLRKALKSYAYAPSHSRKAERRTLFLFSVIGLFLGVGMAMVMKAHYDEVDRVEAIQKQLLQAATPPPGQGEKRWLALEQIKLLLSK